jgi:ABC-type branched-subunit amino acid transport system substrate-binding protein
MRTRKHKWAVIPPTVLSLTLLFSACGGGSDDATPEAQQQPAAVDVGGASTEDAIAPVAAGAGDSAVPAAKGAAPVAAPHATGKRAAGGPAAPVAAGADKAKLPQSETATAKTTSGGLTTIDSAAQRAENDKIAAAKNGATDKGVTSDSIKMGSISMHGVAWGHIFIDPLVTSIRASLTALNDRGGVLGRRVSLVDCDDGPGEVTRTKSCIKKLVNQDKVFALFGITSWGSASVHSDLAQYRLPAIGTWAYSQTEWQDPYMFPTHMSMIHEAMANAHWVKNVVKPATYGMICLTSPEMQLSCNEVQKILDASGSKLVKRMDVGIAETSMSPQVLAMRAANPEHIVHYVINPATMGKFMVESAQQGYYPPKGISGNHLAAEVLGSLFGKHPVGRYWTNTTYKLWGPEMMAVMNKYARGIKGLSHHIIQASYVGVLIFERAAKAIGPNLTRDRLMAQLANGDVYSSDASMDQRFSYSKAERGGSSEHQTWNPNAGQGREFMYKYNGTNTTANPDASPNGFEPDPDQFVIYTNR